MRIRPFIEWPLRIAGVLFILEVIAIAAVVLNYRRMHLDDKVFQPPEYEVARLTSPDGSLDAVLIETRAWNSDSGGNGLMHEIHVVKQGDPRPCASAFATLTDAQRNPKAAAGATLRWNGSRQLLIEYQKASHTYQRFEPQTVEGKEIEVVLRSETADLNAPSGAMADVLRLRGEEKKVDCRGG